MAAPVWVLSVDLQTKTATFQSGMAEAAKSARGAFDEIKSGSTEMSGHIGTNMFASRHAIMAVSEAFGVQMPRAITAFVAHLGPVGPALEAAFPFAAVGLGALLLIEHLAKLRQAAIELTEAQTRFGTAAQTAFNTLDQKFLQAQIRADELRNDHLGALRHELQLIDSQSLQELVQEFDSLAKEADTVFVKLESHWYQFGEGARGAKNAMEEFQVGYAALLSKGDKQGAADLLKGTLESAEKTLSKLKEVSRSEEALRAMASVPLLGPIAGAASMAQDQGKEKQIAAQEKLIELLHDQGKVQQDVSRNTKQEGDNATAETAKAGYALASEGARQAAEHRLKMNEIALQADKEQAAALLDVQEASAMQRLLVDMTLADRERDIQLKGNQEQTAALDRGGKDYENQLKAHAEKAEEIVAQHNATVSELISKAGVEQNAKALQDLQQGERQSIEATQQGTSARLAAITAAMKEEEAKGLQQTSFYRDLANQRTEVIRQAAEEQAKLAAEAGKEMAANAEKLGEMQVAAEKESWGLLASAQRVTLEQRVAQEVLASQQEYALKLTAMQQEAAALDKGSKEYENKLKEYQDKERQLVQQHENDLTAIKEKAEEERNNKILSAESRFNDTIASGLTQVLMGHKSFASMMNSLGDQVVSGMMQNAIKSIMTNDMTKESDAAKAARKAYLTGEEIGGPAGFILGPVMAAAAFAGVMAFEGGGIVPGFGSGDIVPAMLTPGEGIVPKGVMEGLSNMARSGTMGGDTHYHAVVHSRPTIHALDASGVDRVLQRHSDTISRHVQSELRKMNR